MPRLIEKYLIELSSLPSSFNIYKSVSRFIKSFTNDVNPIVDYLPQCNFCNSIILQNVNEKIYTINEERVCKFCISVLNCINNHSNQTAYFITYNGFYNNYFIYCSYCYFSSAKAFIECKYCKYKTIAIYGTFGKLFNYTSFMCYNCQRAQPYNMLKFFNVLHRLENNEKLWTVELKSLKDRHLEIVRPKTLFEASVLLICNDLSIKLETKSGVKLLPPLLYDNFKECLICGYRTFVTHEKYNILYHHETYKNHICDYCSRHMCDNKCNNQALKRTFYSLYNLYKNRYQIFCDICNLDLEIKSYKCNHCNINTVFAILNDDISTKCFYCNKSDALINIKQQKLLDYINETNFKVSDRSFKENFNIQNLYNLSAKIKTQYSTQFLYFYLLSKWPADKEYACLRTIHGWIGNLLSMGDIRKRISCKIVNSQRYKDNGTVNIFERQLIKVKCIQFLRNITNRVDD